MEKARIQIVEKRQTNITKFTTKFEWEVPDASAWWILDKIQELMRAFGGVLITSDVEEQDLTK